jgi:lipoprotein-anchoring transpeptidase ErfK/SrfK
MKRVLIAMLCVWAFTTTAKASEYVDITIDISDQLLFVTTPYGEAVWSVSTGKKRYETPIGDYQPTSLEKMWYSRKYDNAPMPYSVFFKNGYAIHGTEHEDKLGMPASHGCVRLKTENAESLFKAIKYYGMENTYIRVQP